MAMESGKINSWKWKPKNNIITKKKLIIFPKDCVTEPLEK